MSYYSREHSTTFADYPVVEWQPEVTKLENPATSAYAIRLNWNDYDTGVEWSDRFETFMALDGAKQIPALIVGAWGFGSGSGIDAVVEAIATNRDKLPNLRALYVGDILREENEISWIEQGDLSPILNAFPNLEYLVVRGSNGLQFGTIDMPKLKYLRIESGGLSRDIVQTVGRATLPDIETLILWLGTANYGATTTIADLQPFYECKNMPKLKYLGLCDSDIADEIATFIATAPVLKQLETLDLSMGTLSDNGALALLKSPMLDKLKHLDLHHNFLSSEMIAKLKELEQRGLTVDVSDSKGDDARWRFVAVGE